MCINEISCLYEKMNLDEKDDPMIRMKRETYSKGQERMNLCHIGKVIGNKLVNKQGLMYTMNAV